MARLPLDIVNIHTVLQLEIRHISHYLEPQLTQTIFRFPETFKRTLDVSKKISKMNLLEKHMNFSCSSWTREQPLIVKKGNRYCKAGQI